MRIKWKLWHKIPLIITTILLAIFGTRVKASTQSVNYSSVSYRVFWYYLDDRGILNEDYTNYTNGGTGTSLGDEYDYYPYAFNTRLFMGNNTLSANRTYSIMFTYTFSPQNANFYDDFPKNLQWSITGNTTSSASGANEDYISNYNVRVSPTCPTCARYRVYLTVTPSTDIKFIQLNMRIKGNQSEEELKYDFNYFNLPTGSEYISINYNTDESVIVIQEQTQIIKQQTEQIIDIMNGDYEFNQNASETIPGQETIDDYTDEEVELLDGLTFEVEEAEVTINPYASSFIWEIVNRLRGMSGKIVLLFTSILSLGLIKMVLNR